MNPITEIFGPPDLSPLCDDDYENASFFERFHIYLGIQPNPQHFNNKYMGG